MDLWSERFLFSKYQGIPYTLPTMTSNTAPEGLVESNVSTGSYTNAPYNFWFNRNWYFEADGRTGSRYNRYTFVSPLMPGKYTISFGGNLQSQDRNTGSLSVWFDDGSKLQLLTYTLLTSGQSFSKTFTCSKAIATISLDMTVSTYDHKNDVTTFYNMNIVCNSGPLKRVKV